MNLHDPKIIIMPAVILPRGGNTAGFSATDAIRSQLLYSWLHFTGMDRMEEITFRW
jgi:hypothetical protein